MLSRDLSYLRFLEGFRCCLNCGFDRSDKDEEKSAFLDYMIDSFTEHAESYHAERFLDFLDGALKLASVSLKLDETGYSLMLGRIKTYFEEFEDED